MKRLACAQCVGGWTWISVIMSEIHLQRLLQRPRVCLISARLAVPLGVRRVDDDHCAQPRLVPWRLNITQNVLVKGPHVLG
eukprot:5696520-Pyramimonas_sp.AAC.1